MKKVDDEKLLEMLKQGIQQKVIAKHFGCSEPYITKRKKKLGAMKDPVSAEKLTEKEIVFVKELAKGKNGMEAALIAFDCNSKDSAKSIACKLLKEPDIKVFYDDLLAQVGIPRRRRAERTRDLIESNDYSAVAKGLDIANKLTGDYTERIEITGQFSTLDADVKAIKELIALEKDYKEFQEWKKQRQGVVDVQIESTQELTSCKLSEV